MTVPRLMLRSERGSALITSLLVIGIMLSISLPLMSVVDTQQRATSGARLHESSFNLTDAVLNAQVFVLSNSWPATVDQAYPVCTQASVSLRCPDPSAIAASYSGADYSPATWRVRVRDDGATGADFYDPAVVDAQPSWDANANGKMWVRADARGTGPNRTIVAQVRLTEHVETFPRNVVTAGHFSMKKKAKKKAVVTLANGAQPATLAVRCTGGYGSACLDFKPKKKWLVPNIVQTGYTGNALPPAAIDRLRQRAKMLGSYYETCPTSPEGPLVFVESGDCVYVGDKKRATFGTRVKGGRVEVNSASAPGVFVIASGSVTFTKKLTYYGMVYAANLTNRTDDLILVLKSARIQGAVAADGDGGVGLRASKTNLIYDESVFWSIRSLQGATVVQGSWREI